MNSFNVNACGFCGEKSGKSGFCRGCHLLLSLSNLLVSLMSTYFHTLYFPLRMVFSWGVHFPGRKGKTTKRGDAGQQQKEVCVCACVCAHCVIQLPLHASLSQSVCMYERQAFIQRLEKVFSQHRPLILS